jgi:L-ribulose-5-phosphate 3-epimerase
MSSLLSRRDFIVRSAQAAAVTALVGAIPQPARAGEFTGRIRKAVKYHMVTEDLSVLDKFKLLKDLGFDGTELRTRDKADRREVAKAIEKTGLPVHGVVNSDDPDITAAIELAKYYGGDSVLVVARYDRGQPFWNSWKTAQATIRKALPAAEKHGVRVLVENVWAGFLISALGTERFVDEIDNPWFGSYFDVGNNVRWGVPQHWIQVLGKRIGKLDIKEWDDRLHQKEGLRAGFSSELGEGTIDWKAVRGELAKLGFQGWATAEVKGGGRERLADIAERMNRVLDL